jgi:hypothetical protein
LKETSGEENLQEVSGEENLRDVFSDYVLPTRKTLLTENLARPADTPQRPPCDDKSGKRKMSR